MRNLVFGFLMGIILKKDIELRLRRQIKGVVVLNVFLYCLSPFDGLKEVLIQLMISLCLQIAWIDWYTMEIDSIALIVLCFLVGMICEPFDCFHFLIMILLLFLSYALALRTNWIGEGDIVLIFIFSLVLRESIFMAIQIACISALLLVFMKKKSQRIPFAPFLCFGFLVMLLNFV